MPSQRGELQLLLTAPHTGNLGTGPATTSQKLSPSTAMINESLGIRYLGEEEISINGSSCSSSSSSSSSGGGGGGGGGGSSSSTSSSNSSLVAAKIVAVLDGWLSERSCQSQLLRTHSLLQERTTMISSPCLL